MEIPVNWLSATPIPGEAKRQKDPDWERKQRLREYRVAARREKRNRKADEKKQRKLNATILRRMTRNPDKYTKNADRNRLRAIQDERRNIYISAVKQAQRLASIYDPSGESFNVGPVIAQDDGTVVSLESLRRREEREAAKQASQTQDNVASLRRIDADTEKAKPDQTGAPDQARRTLSKTQQKKLAANEPRPPPPKPMIPKGIPLPHGEENWLELWDASDEQIERRVLREKKRKAGERKALRQKQKSLKVERRAARDMKRKVYRDLKLTWKMIKEEQTKHKTRLKSAEEEESKKLADQINVAERAAALLKCAELGFTMANVTEVNDVKPKAYGMKGVEVDFEAIDLTRPHNEMAPNSRKTRIDLSKIASESRTQNVPTDIQANDDAEEFIKIDPGDGEGYEAARYNHKVRRKLRRAIETAEIQKETLVREQACASLRQRGMPVPDVLTTAPKPVHLRGHRTLENGSLETDKGERVRLRLELAEYNKAARVLRKQAKQIAMEAGLRTYAEMTGRIPSLSGNESMDVEQDYGPGWYKS